MFKIYIYFFLWIFFVISFMFLGFFSFFSSRKMPLKEKLLTVSWDSEKITYTRKTSIIVLYWSVIMMVLSSMLQIC